MLTGEQARELLDSIDTSTVVGLRDRALISVMTFALARIGAAVAMRAEDYYRKGKRWWVRLHEKGGKRHEMPAHHNLETYLDAYIKAAGIGDQTKSPLFRSAAGRTDMLIRELEGDSFEGALLTDANKQKGVILYKAGARIERRRFTIAHELCHFLMPSHKGNQQCTAADLRESRRDTDHRRREAEANRFAAGLLMPRPWFSRDLDRLGNADVAHVMTLSKQYCTSLEATSNRYCELTDDTCAFVFAKDNVIRYARRSATFPRLSLSTGDGLPIGSSSLRASSLPLRVASAWSEVDGSVWLETERGRQAPKVLEQTIRQSDGFQATLLFIAPEEIEDDEDAEIEKSWEVGFRRR